MKIGSSEIGFFEMSQQKLTVNNIILLISLLIIILFLPVFSGHNRVIQLLVITAIIVSGSFSLDFRLRALIILVSSGVVAIFLNWLAYFFDWFGLAALLSSFCFNGFITVFMIRHIFKAKQVTGTIILNSINCYMLIGLLGALLLSIVEKMEKMVFQSDIAAISFAGSTIEEFHDYLYFSFVTLSTLGYGDITPISPTAKSITLIIAVTGQLYLTILIAVLVGKFLRQNEKNE